MLKCQTCTSHRIADVYAKCRDLCTVKIGSAVHDGYVPIEPRLKTLLDDLLQMLADWEHYGRLRSLLTVDP